MAAKNRSHDCNSGKENRRTSTRDKDRNAEHYGRTKQALRGAEANDDRFQSNSTS